MVLLQLFDSLILQGIESPQVSGQHLAVQTLITDRKILRTAWFCLPRIYISYGNLSAGLETSFLLKYTSCACFSRKLFILSGKSMFETD